MAIIPRWQTPISRWSLEGNANDLYGLHNGTPTNITYSTDAKEKGLSGSFNGSSSVINCGNWSFFSYTNFSISLWVKPTVNSTSDALLTCTRPGYDVPRVQFMFDSSGWSNYVIVNDAGSVICSIGGPKCNDGTWHHVCLVDANGTVRHYIDGVGTELSGTYTRSSLNNFTSVNLGMMVLAANQRPFAGLMDDVRFYDVALTADEVINLYKSYATPIWQQPLHHWKFENDLNDSVGSSNGSNTNCTFYPNNNINGNYSIYIPQTPTGYPTFPGINIAGYTNFTWAFWFRSVISGVQQYLVMDWTYPGGPDERLSLVLNTNNRLVIYPYIGGNFRPIYSTTNLNIAAWNHVVLTASGTGSTYFTLYLNGKYDISGTQPRSTYATNTFRLGVHSPGVTAAKFDGYMDDFRIYDVALSASDVKALYNSYFTDKATSLLPFIG